MFIETILAALGRDQPAFEQAALRLTGSQTKTMLLELARWLEEHCEPGDRVAAISRNRVETVLLEWATYYRGCIWIGIPSREREAANVERILADFTPTLLVLDRSAPYGGSSLDREAFPAQEVEPPSALDPVRFRALRRKGRPQPADTTRFEVDDERVQRIRYSSGSTGEPKAVAYMDRTSQAILEMITAEILSKGQEKAVLNALPLAWAAGSLIAPALHLGRKNVILESWNAAELARAVAQEESVLTFLTPGSLAELVRFSELHGAGWAHGLKRVLVAGSPLPVWTLRRAQALFEGAQFVVTLGQTEASFPITLYPAPRDPPGAAPPHEALVPLGALTNAYIESEIGEDGELRLRGAAVAPAIWQPEAGGAEGCFVALPKPHSTGDRVRCDAHKNLHYLGRKTTPWRVHDGLPVPDAIEAVVNDCPGIRRSRVDLIERGEKGVQADITVQPEASLPRTERVRRFFEAYRAEACLPNVVLDHIEIAPVPLTLSGKLLRPGRKPSRTRDAEPPGGGSPSPGSWREVDLSSIASGPLYFYVGAGLSTAAGLVGWSEMACLIWRYLDQYERAQPDDCPLDSADDNERFLADFVIRNTELGSGVRILSRESEGPGAETSDGRAFSRAALLNMLLRYRAPRYRVIPAHNKCAESEPGGSPRPRPGEEPNAEDLAVHHLLWKCGCHGILTSNYDLLLEHTHSLAGRGAALRSYRYTADLLRFILSNRRFVLHLHGDINDIATMEFHPSNAWEKGGSLGPPGNRGEDLRRVYARILERGHVIYLGCGFRDETIRRLHDGRRGPGEAGRTSWLALVPRAELPRILAHQFPGITFLTWDDPGEVREFVERVHSVRSQASRVERPSLEASDLHRQLFHSEPGAALRRNLCTDPWTCKALAPR